MSFNDHKRKAEDSSLVRYQRCSHLRSCALSLSRLKGTARSFAIAEVAELTGVNIMRNDLDDTQIKKSLAYLVTQRIAFLGASKG